MKLSPILQILEKYCAPNYLPLPIVLTKGRRVWVWDNKGNKYLDLLSCYSALNLGYSHPRIEKVYKDQVKKLLNCPSRAFVHQDLALICKELAEFCGMEMVSVKNSGAEAVETAIKAARKWGYKIKKVFPNRAEIIVCENNFHGRTTTIISFSSEPLYREDFGPYTPGFKIIPYGDARSLEKAITKNTVAFLVEPIQGEAGVIVPPEGYLKEIREICSKYNILLILDEIQTGLGRTGKIFACQYEGIKPDIFCLGKALGGGILPVSAAIGSREIFSLLGPGTDGSTFGGYPLGAALGREVLKIIKEEKLAERARELGDYFMSKLKTLRSPFIAEIRGRGLLIGVELKPEAGGARKFCEALMKEGLLCKETHENVIRFAPPLIIKKKEIDWAFQRIKKILEAKN